MISFGRTYAIDLFYVIMWSLYHYLETEWSQFESWNPPHERHPPIISSEVHCLPWVEYPELQNLFQLSGALMWVVRKATGVCMSCCALADRSRSHATMWWKMTAWSSGNGVALLASLTLNKWSLTGIVEGVLMTSGNLLIILLLYFTIDTDNTPGVE